MKPSTPITIDSSPKPPEPEPVCKTLPQHESMDNESNVDVHLADLVKEENVETEKVVEKAEEIVKTEETVESDPFGPALPPPDSGYIGRWA